MRSLGLALLLALGSGAPARADPASESRQSDELEKSGRAAGLRDARKGAAFEPDYAAKLERHRLAWNAGYQTGWTEGRLERRVRSGQHMRVWGTVLSILGSIGMAVMSAGIAASSNPSDFIGSLVAIVAGPIGGIELGIGLPLLIGGIARILNAREEQRLLGDPEMLIHHAPYVTALVVHDGAGLALSTRW